MRHTQHAARYAAVASLVLAAACADNSPLLPAPTTEPGADHALVECSVSRATASMQCAPVQPATSGQGPNLNRIIGGQDRYIKLANSGNAFAGTVFSTQVTVQNLMQSALGTSDGDAVTGVSVFFFSGPTVTGGTGGVSVLNPTGTAAFISDDVPYFRYDQALQPYEISRSKEWQFQVDPGVTSFKFQVYVSASLVNETTLLGNVWTGSANGVWSNAANWSAGVPDSLSTAAIPADSLLAGGHPELDADTRTGALRVGYGSGLNLNGHTLRSSGTVDAQGAISGGTLRLDGSARVGGALPSVVITGARHVQSTVSTSGAVSIQGDGSLTVADRVVTISVP
ncbi:MAG TPA: hypothetical protein VF665_20385 [Longimicrobium sp.]|jgi:hypothetical protein|uniref:hypothetical protein n=1 Tax=Longimicrobium sp. TaxID=2029185 RepID=UPI002ED94084